MCAFLFNTRHTLRRNFFFFSWRESNINSPSRRCARANDAVVFGSSADGRGILPWMTRRSSRSIAAFDFGSRAFVRSTLSVFRSRPRQRDIPSRWSSKVGWPVFTHPILGLRRGDLLSETRSQPAGDGGKESGRAGLAMETSYSLNRVRVVARVAAFPRVTSRGSFPSPRVANFVPLGTCPIWKKICPSRAQN